MVCKGLRDILASRNCGTSLIERYDDQWDHLHFLLIKDAELSLASQDSIYCFQWSWWSLVGSHDLLCFRDLRTCSD